MPEWFIEILKFAGIGAFMFFTFYIYHKSSAEMFKSISTANAEMLKDNNDNMFKLLDKVIEQNILQLTYSQKFDTKVSNNLWCPMVKKMSHDEKQGSIIE